jgi:2'-5' RNA ligase
MSISRADRARVIVPVMDQPGPPSVLLLEVPAAEPVVASLRERLDSSAALGIPAHITVLYPFVPAGQIGPELLARLAVLFRGVAGFGFRLGRTDWFGENVLWLGPEPEAPFRDLSGLVCQEFPGSQPYEGKFTEVVPHLTIGHGRPLAELREAERVVQPSLPVKARATSVSLYARPAEGARWTRTATFALG